MKLKNETYNILKWLVLIALPALAVAYGALGDTWGFPYVEEIVRTINVIAVFIGALIGVSTINYNNENKLR